MVREIPYTAPQGVIDAIRSLGRTEDVRFSPSNRRLAVASFHRNRVVVFDLEIAPFSGTTRIALTGGVELSSPDLQLPHGLDFIDDDTLIVTSRGSDVAVFKLPAGAELVPTCEVPPIARWPVNENTLLHAPGSVAVGREEEGVCEILICNNDGNTVTRHLWDRAVGGVPRSSEILLHENLDLPDGVSVSPDRQWLAVSNHNTHNVMLYENATSLNPSSKPDAILRGVHYPHGLRFSADSRQLFVADAGAPSVHIYARGSDHWRGVQHPVATIEVMDDAVFKNGRHNREEGGPKGLDVASNVLVVTSGCQPLAFFDVPALLQEALAVRSAQERANLEIDYELSAMQESHKIMAEKADELEVWRKRMDGLAKSFSWRVTGPLRRLKSILRGRNES